MESGSDTTIFSEGEILILSDSSSIILMMILL